MIHLTAIVYCREEQLTVYIVASAWFGSDLAVLCVGGLALSVSMQGAESLNMWSLMGAKRVE